MSANLENGPPPEPNHLWDTRTGKLRAIPAILVAEVNGQAGDAMRLLRQERMIQLCAVDTGAAAARAVAGGNYDVLIVDAELPDQDGLEFIRWLRMHQYVQPVVMLSSLKSERDRVRGLELCWGDYLVKPFDARELVARVRAILRRLPTPTRVSTMEVGVKDVMLDVRQRQLTRAAERVALTPTEANVLFCLLEQRGRIVTRSELREAVWQSTHDSGSNYIDVTISRLRSKLEGLCQDPVIRTVRGLGFTVDAAVENSQKQAW